MFTDADRSHFLEGVRLFNAGRYFEAHEVWEDAWRPMDAGTLREFLQGLIQCAVAMEHHRRGNAVGAARVLERATRRLAGVPGGYAGVDLAELLRRVEGALAREPGGAPRIRLADDRPPAPGQPDGPEPVSEG
jgi:predicted metal-dependent hydrolase